MGSSDGDDTISISITDGGDGDDDLTANGTIVDQGGPGVPNVPPPPPTPVPTLTEWGLLILAGLVAGYGVWTLRRRAQLLTR